MEKGHRQFVAASVDEGNPCARGRRCARTRFVPGLPGTRWPPMRVPATRRFRSDVQVGEWAVRRKSLGLFTVCEEQSEKDK